MDNQERYDERDNIVSSLNILINEITDKDYIDMLNEIKYQAQDELQQLEEILQVEQWQEIQQMNNEFERSRL